MKTNSSNDPARAPQTMADETAWARRDFLNIAAATAIGMACTEPPVMAGPFDQSDWDQIIPADKKLHPDWVKSLFARGEPTVYTKARGELDYIGMPVGGICCGTIYLGGDGRLWNWDIFNQKIEGVLPRFVKWSDVGMNFATGDNSIRPRDGATFVKPAVPDDSPAIAQGFAIRVISRQTTDVRRLDGASWSDVRFGGQYPIGTVEYSDPGAIVKVKLEAFSPFIPHNTDDSGLPATILRFSVTNLSSETITVDLAGWLQNATNFYSAKASDGQRVNRILQSTQATIIEMAFEKHPLPSEQPRPDIVIENFEQGYGKWVSVGEAFGNQPARRDAVPTYQGELGGEGDKVVNSHASAPGSGVEEKDDKTGRLTSAPFTIQRKFVAFYVGGGRREDVGIKLIVEGKVVRTARGRDANHMHREAFDVAEFEGHEAVIEVYDEAKGPWANIGADDFVQTDAPKVEIPIDQRPDFGTMALAAVGNGQAISSIASERLPDGAFETSSENGTRFETPIGAVSQQRQIAAGQSAEFTFVVAWHFPHTTVPCPDAKAGNYYSKRFRDATSVINYIVAELPRLESLTRLWRDTWYDTTLPNWFMERTFANISILATTTAHRFATGRFWAWEGIGCCEGTCTHVWHYAQAVGRIFPEIERDLRERVDFGVGFEAVQGMVRHRGEGTGPAIDGHCGRILGVWREHQMSTTDAFLRRVWPNVRKALEYVIDRDADGDGILDGAQENTLDAAWYGQIAWISSLAIAACRAGEEMAKELDDLPIAARCRQQYEKARRSVEAKLFNGEYFFQIADPQREKSLGTYEACHIDQVHGQSWAWQVNLGRVLDREKTLTALRSLWKYNFAPDVGPFRKKYTAGRPYALAGDAGLVMATNPKLIEDVYGISSWQIGYFNECMSGFEHQVASHMMAEGMVLESLAITRAIHDRYHAGKRNPFNEIECSDHYARAMASYGTFITACGFESHGPSGHIGFAPKLTPENFRAPFTVAGGWGAYTQQRAANKQLHTFAFKYGQTRVKTLAVEVDSDARVSTVVAKFNGMKIPARVLQNGARVEILFDQDVQLQADMSLDVELAIST